MNGAVDGSVASVVTGFSGLIWAPLLPWSLLAGLGAGALIIVGYAALRRAGGTLWRLLALFVALLALVNPKLIEEQPAFIRKTKQRFPGAVVTDVREDTYDWSKGDEIPF